MLGKPPPPGFDPATVAPPLLGERLWGISALAPDVAGECNLACRYCAEAATQPRRRPMSPGALNAAWHLLFPDGRPRKGFSVRLGSGEPLLALSLLHRLAKLVEEGGGSEVEGRPAVFLTTNGTLINGKIRDWLVSSGWHVKLSLDGPKCIHDNWRVTPNGVGTFEQVAQAVTELALKMPDRLSVTAVLCHGADPKEVFESIVSLGVRRVELVPVVHQDTSILPRPADIENYEIFVKDYARRYLNYSEGADFPSLVRFESCVVRVMGYAVRRVPCGAGRSLIGVGPDGDLYPCFRFIGLKPYRIGRLSTGLDRKAALAFQRGPGRTYEERITCSKCWAAPLCGGPCFACAEMFGPGNGEPLVLHCAYALADARCAIWLVNQLRQRNPERLLSFLPNLSELIGP